jgi:hypothetical protein
VVEVRVADEHEICPLDLRDAQADRIEARHPVEVTVEEQVEPRSAGAEGSGTEPLDGPGAHPRFPYSPQNTRFHHRRVSSARTVIRGRFPFQP